MKLLEIIPTADTAPAIVEQMREFAAQTLGKGMVLCKDTPNFIANRIGTYSGMTGMRYAFDHGFSIEEVDALTGPLIGRPKTASFRLADLAGMDIMVDVAENLYDLVPDDESRDEYRVPEPVKRMVAAGLARQQDRRRASTSAWTAPAASASFTSSTSIHWNIIRRRSQTSRCSMKRAQSAISAQRLRFIMEGADAGDRYAQLVEATIVPTLAYAARRVPEISDTITGIDDAMRWGFAQERGPFETWDLLGVAETVARMERHGIAVAPWVTEMLATGHPTFYRARKRPDRSIQPDHEAVRTDPARSAHH